MKPTDPRYIQAQYASGDHLAVIADTHDRYGTAQEDVFTRLTRTLAEEGPAPRHVLDIGAGTGKWYASIRDHLGPPPRYTAVDQSMGMVQAVLRRIQGDPQARAVVGDARALPFADGTFSWVGMHFVAYFLPDIEAGLLEAWRLVEPGGILACATNDRRPHYELWSLQEEAVRRLGLPGAENSVTASDRFHLDNGSAYFPMPPCVYRWPAGFRFTEPEAVVRYLSAGPIRKHLGVHADDPSAQRAALDWIHAQVDAVIRASGAFEVHSEVGFFLLRRA
jgi:ubiquinone/menaquinone biosynthesis C-methylase UbiE